MGIAEAIVTLLEVLPWHLPRDTQLHGCAVFLLTKCVVRFYAFGSTQCTVFCAGYQDSRNPLPPSLLHVFVYDAAEFKIPVFAKFCETLLSSLVHSQHRHGELYLVRIFDFVFTFTILVLGKKLVPSRAHGNPRPNLMIPLALAASLSWLEFGQLEFSTTSFMCAPPLAIARAFSLLTMQQAYVRLSEGTTAVVVLHVAAHLEQFCLYYTGFTSVALFLPALISYSTSHVEVDASWESIDYTLMGLSFLFMSCNLYSDLWLGLQLNARAYATLDHTKYLGASIGQWIVQNMAHPNVIAFGGKVLTIACLFRISARS
ncbi:hypothetical protein NECAME_05153 [Necator americanus]|uniref:Uncharacterized protein n=1 Tax=Necator americanus TaxID=51031 RepID=W2SLF1_NECAM|nr:hypothetical protein NECAME_05153 [Necator americanus]ETN69696.1 hypothetical protein NECAME_05153 [Necator americanus]